MIRSIFLFILSSFVMLQANVLLGKWISHTQEQDISLEFISNSQLIYDGEQSTYKISGSVIKVANEYGFVDYPFSKNGNLLRISFPEGYQLVFKKQKKIKTKTNKGNNTSYLYGRLCHYSSSYNGGYSTTSWVVFDGKGHFQTGSGSSYSGENGLYQGAGNSGGGTYSVVGKAIHLKANDGSTYQGKVIEWKNNGHVTAVKINNRVYGSALCD